MSQVGGFLVVVVMLASPAAGVAQGIDRDEALASVYPGAAVTSERVFLDAAQQKAVEARAGAATTTALVARYVASRNGQVVGRAYVDTHTVRTKKESLLISLDADGSVLRIDVTAFREPREYLAPDAWLRQYGDRELTNDLAINRAIRPIAGATLTARAVNAAVRRVLAIDAVLRRAGSTR
jgi:Na+-translocating ferredoxin:NAD+ oxidoreductase subunit G